MYNNYKITPFHQTGGPIKTLPFPRLTDSENQVGLDFDSFHPARSPL